MTAAKTDAIDTGRVRAAVFDLGGVIIEGGPAEVRRFGESVGLEARAWETIRRELFGNTGPWAALERGETSLATFAAELKDRVQQAGTEISDHQALSFMGTDRPMSDGSRLRTGLVEAIAGLRDLMPVAMLTNNVREWRSGWRQATELTGLFDVIIDSSEVGTRKPEPAIYEITRQRLDVAHSGIFFVDDIGQNLKAARALGWQTYLYREEAALLELLGRISTSRPASGRPQGRSPV